MTVLQGKEARGADLGQLARIIGTVFAVGLITAGAVFAMTRTDGVETIAPAQALAEARAQALVEVYEARHLAQLDALNKADIGTPEVASSTAPIASAGTHVPGAAWSSFQTLHVPGAAWGIGAGGAGSGAAVFGPSPSVSGTFPRPEPASSNVDLSGRIEGYPTSPPATASGSEPDSRTFGTQIAK